VPWTCVGIITGHGNTSELYLSFVCLLNPQSDHFSLNNIGNTGNTPWKKREQLKSLFREQRTWITHKVRPKDFRLKASFHEKAGRVGNTQRGGPGTL